MDSARATQALLRHLDTTLSSRPEDELIAQVLGGAEPAATLLATASRLARLPFWERRALGAVGLVRDHKVPAREAIRLAALWELAERWYPDERPVVTTPGAALHLLQGLRSLAREEVWALLLDARHRLLSIEPVVAGSLNSARLLPRDVFTPALRAGAAAIIVAHNHPSGEVSPSRADRLVTAALRDASRILGLPLLDHLILTARAHFSFREVEAWEADTGTAAA
ncbi:MAG TPA: JAB domain-containing protein [Candidatus Binatia bacterium]|nr:JAB domain-containing protein [Candidatus Binatia bacterium]